VADAVESLADIVGSAIVYGGIRLGRRNPDETTPYGYGKAEPLAALAVSLLLIGAAIAIAFEAIREIRTPHHTPAWWTLLVLVIVIVVKETVFRMQRRRASASGSSAAQADAWHHRAEPSPPSPHSSASQLSSSVVTAPAPTSGHPPMTGPRSWLPHSSYLTPSSS